MQVVFGTPPIDEWTILSDCYISSMWKYDTIFECTLLVGMEKDCLALKTVRVESEPGHCNMIA
jgi:hypothetical protein